MNSFDQVPGIDDLPNNGNRYSNPDQYPNSRLGLVPALPFPIAMETLMGPVAVRDVISFSKTAAVGEEIKRYRRRRPRI